MEPGTFPLANSISKNKIFINRTFLAFPVHLSSILSYPRKIFKHVFKINRKYIIFVKKVYKIEKGCYNKICNNKQEKSTKSRKAKQMYKCEREDEILSLLNETGYATVEYLSAKMTISASSIRRDLKNLEEVLKKCKMI